MSAWKSRQLKRGMLEELNITQGIPSDEPEEELVQEGDTNTAI